MKVSAQLSLCAFLILIFCLKFTFAQSDPFKTSTLSTLSKKNSSSQKIIQKNSKKDFNSLVKNENSQKLGIFDNQSDIGQNVKQGTTNFSQKTNLYTVTGSGSNIWSNHDEFHFVWKKIKGDFILSTRASLVDTGFEPHRKLGWMVRASLDDNSPQICVAEHGDGLTALQFRRVKNGLTEEIRSELKSADILQLERKGKVYTMRVARFGEPFVKIDFSDIELGDEVYVGLFVCSHNAAKIEKGIFENVQISVPFPGISNQGTSMSLGSNLELLDIYSGKREIVYSVSYSIQAPNWMIDGTHLIFNDYKGLLYNFDLDKRTTAPINTGSINNNNNDHVLSFDGSQIGLSSDNKNLGGSTIYTVPIAGGDPKQITQNSPSYLHGWSPDGKDLVFCGSRDGEFDVYKIGSSGGKELKLTNTKGLDDGPEYSPDGKYIYFNSVRSGLMQIWRMYPDGTNQEQITNDDFNNWFAHISPDGKWMVYLSFLKEETEPGIHPPYKHVYIQLKSTLGGSSKVIAYVYGGQGTINTPSWSPDSKRIAFVSNTVISKP